jgi:hypothetical protein
VLRGTNRGRSCGHNHCYLEPDEFGRQVGEPLGSPFCIAELKDEVLPLDITELAQTLSERLLTCLGHRGGGREGRTEPTNPVHWCRLLGLGPE